MTIPAAAMAATLVAVIVAVIVAATVAVAATAVAAVVPITEFIGSGIVANVVYLQCLIPSSDARVFSLARCPYTGDCAF